MKPLQNSDAISADNDSVVDRFILLYQELDKENLDKLETLYHPDIVFIDPFHRINGLDELQRYFFAMYQNLQYIRFEIKQVITEERQACIEWDMHYAHKRIKKAQSICVAGASWLTFDSLILTHRDYFDAGAMLYQHLPMLGRMISLVNKRMSV